MRLHPEADYASEIVVRDLASGDERSSYPSTSLSSTPSGHPTAARSSSTPQDSAPDARTIYRIDLDAPEAAPVVVVDLATGDGWGGVKPVYSPDGRTSCSSASRRRARTASA